MIFKKETSDDFFQISFEQNDTNKKLKLCNEWQNTYSEQNEIDCILSHLTTIDESKKENKKKSGDFKSEMIDFTISYGVNGKKVSEKISVPFGYGHFEKGINYLRDNFSQGLSLIPELEAAANSDNCRKRLDNKCKGFKKPTLDMADLQSLGRGTIDVCVDIAKGLSNEELGAFLKGFQEHNRQERNKRSNKKEDSKENYLIDALAKKLGVDSKELEESIKQHLIKKEDSQKDLTHDANAESNKTKKDSAKESKFSKNPTPSEAIKKKMATKRSEIAKTKKSQAVGKSKANERSKTKPPLNIERA